MLSLNRRSAYVVLMCALLGAAMPSCQSDSPPDETSTPGDSTISLSVPDTLPDAPVELDTLNPSAVNNDKAEPSTRSRFPYDLTQPDKKWKLGSKLNEISGLTYLGDNLIACVQDEDGLIFQFDTKSGKIEGKSDFGKDGDYEGITVTDEHVYVLRSNGDLYRVKKLTKDPKKKHYETRLKQENDVEGLCYQARYNRLLLACKGYPGKGDDLKHHKAIYAFDLEDKKVSKKPVYTIDVRELSDSVGENVIASGYGQLAEFFNPGEGDLTFNPSAIGEHPITQELYLLSSAGKVMVILTPEGKIARVLPLDRKVFKQPEGITFEPDGTMYISNEGRGGSANILRFDYKP